MATGFATVAGSVVSNELSKKGTKKAKGLANGIVPETIETGRSRFNTKQGNTTLDPSIRRSQVAFGDNIRGLIDSTSTGFDNARKGIRDLQGRSAEARADFEGNQSNFREAQLAGTREGIATRRGQLDRELNRTNVRGTFANQSRNAFSLDSARELRRAEGEVENQRINKLGDFLQIDADLLKTGLQTEVGRVGLISELENTIASIGSEQFNQELALLGLPAQFISGNSAKANINANAQGIQAQQTAQLAGDVIDLFD